MNHLSSRRLLLVLAGQGIPLGLDTLLSPLAGGLGLRTLGVHVGLDLLLTSLLGLRLVNLELPSVMVQKRVDVV